MKNLGPVVVGMAVLVAVLVVSGQTAHAKSITIDFQAFAAPALLPAGATENGYFLTDIGAAAGVVTPAGFGGPPPVGTSQGYGPGGPASTPELEITSVGGIPFQLSAFELFFPFPGTLAVATSVTGYFGGGVVGSDVFVPTGPTGVPPGPLPAFTPTNLAGVTVDRLVFDMGAGFSNPIIIDNIVLSAIPEPSTMLLCGAGLLGLGWCARRRRTKARAT